MADLNVALIMRLVDKASGPMRQIQGELNDADRKRGRVLKAAGKAAAAGVAAFGAAAGVAMTTSINKAAEFEGIMNRVQDATGAGADGLDDLRDLAEDLGRSTQYRATESAEMLETLAKNGLTAEQILAGAARSSLDLAAATGSALPHAADIATDAMAQFKQEVGDLDHVNDQIVGTLKTSKFDIDDYRLALGQAGGAAAEAGVEMEDFNAALAASAYMFSSGSDAGTSLKTFMQRLVPQSEAAAKAMNAVGLSFHDEEGNLKSMTEIAEALQDSLGEMSEQRRTGILNDIFGADAMRTALALMNQGGEGIEEILAMIEKGSAEESALARMMGLNGARRELGSVIEGIQIDFGQHLLPYVEANVRRLNRILRRVDVDELMEGLQDRVRDIRPIFDEAREAAEAVGDRLGDALAPVRGRFEANAARLRSIVMDLVGPILGAFGQGGRVRTALATLGNLALDGAVAALGAYADAQERVLDVAGEAVDWIQKRAGGIDWESLAPPEGFADGTLADAVEMLDAVRSSLSSFFDIGQRSIGAYLAGFYDGLDDHLAPAIERLSGIWDRASGTFGAIAEAWTSLATSLGLIEAGDMSGVTAFGEAMGNLLGTVTLDALTVLDKLLTVTEGIARTIAGLAQGDADKALAPIREFFDWAQGIGVPDFAPALAGIWDDLPAWPGWSVILPDFRLNFSWADALPTFDWATIIPGDLPGWIKNLASAGDELSRLRGIADDGTGRFQFEFGQEVVSEIEAGELAIGDAIDRLEAKLSDTGFLDSQKANRLIDQLQKMQDIAADTAPTVQTVKADNAQVDALQSKIAEVTAAADALPPAIREMVVQVEAILSGLDLTAHGQRMMDTLAAGIRAGTAGVVAAVEAMASQVRSAMPTSPAVNMAPAGDIQARATGGPFGPGRLRVGEHGVEDIYLNRAGFVAHHRQVQEMERMTRNIRRNVGRARPVDRGYRPLMSGGGGGAAARGGDTITVNVHPAPGMNEERLADLAVRKLQRSQRRAGQALHDGGFYE